MKTSFRTIANLYEHAKSSMTVDELDAMSDSFMESSVNLGQQMSMLFEGVACLILQEHSTHQAGHPVSGSLQSPERVFEMFCMAATNFEAMAGMVELAEEAKFKADQKRVAA